MNRCSFSAQESTVREPAARIPHHGAQDGSESFRTSPVDPLHPGDRPQRPYSPFPLCPIFAAAFIATTYSSVAVSRSRHSEQTKRCSSRAAQADSGSVRMALLATALWRR